MSKEILQFMAEYPLRTPQIAELAGIDKSRVRHLVKHIARADLAINVGREWRYKKEAVDFVRNRKNTITPFI